MDPKFFGLFGNAGKAEPEVIEDGEICDQPQEQNLRIDHQPTHDELVQDFRHRMDSRNRLRTVKQCHVCKMTIGRYTCPRCSIKTCSVRCSRKHKIDTGCSGIRDPVSFVPISNYSSVNMNSDCNFLGKGDVLLKDSNRIIQNTPQKQTSHWAVRFMQECHRRNISYEKMPLAFKKARTNKSIFLYGPKEILWDIDFGFPNCDAEKNTMFEFKRERISENRTLRDIIDETINRFEWIDKEDDKEMIKQIDFEPYRNEEWTVLLRNEHGPVRYSVLDPKLSLKRNLEHRNVVEYPGIVVVLTRLLGNFLPEH